MRSPCIGCHREEEDKNLCIKECQRIRAYQEHAAKATRCYSIRDPRNGGSRRVPGPVCP